MTWSGRAQLGCDHRRGVECEHSGPYQAGLKTFMFRCVLFWFQFLFCVTCVSQFFQFPKLRKTLRYFQVNHGAFTCHFSTQGCPTKVSCRCFCWKSIELGTLCCRCTVGAGTQWVVAQGPPINWPNIWSADTGPCWLLSACRHTRCCSPAFICCATYTVCWHIPELLACDNPAIRF